MKYALTLTVSLLAAPFTLLPSVFRVSRFPLIFTTMYCQRVGRLHAFKKHAVTLGEKTSQLILVISMFLLQLKD